MKHKTKQDLMEVIAASTFSEKLQDRIEQDQRYIAVVGEDVSAMAWPKNILGEMENLVRARDYVAILDHLETWEDWLDRSRDIERRLRETMILLRQFVDFFQQTNGAIEHIEDVIE